jgi:uncharacterized protein YndB with AHSA1/START domain
MSHEPREIRHEIEVDGTPEEVWEAIATGPGISSWYVPHTVEEREGGAVLASFGEGPELQIPGRVAAWQPPYRVVFDGGEHGEGLAFEWLVEARDGGTCIVRLVNTGFGTGAAWDDQFDGMNEGWLLFLLNLQLHRHHFPGQHAVTCLPGAMWPGPRDRTWRDVTAALGIPAQPSVGEHLILEGDDTPPLGGTVASVAPWRLALVLDRPLPGTAFLAVEGAGDAVGVSVWSYLYGAAAPATAAGLRLAWQEWLEQHAPRSA